jgi:hypothetical protein
MEKKKITDIHEKEFIKKLLRNSFVVFDSLITNIKENPSTDVFKMGSTPLFGKSKHKYDNENFVFEPVHLKREKAAEMIRNSFEGRKLSSGSEVQAHILSSMNMKLRASSDNCFISVSAAKFSVNKERTLSRDEFEAMMYLRYLSENNSEFELERPSEKILYNIRSLMTDPKMYSVFHMHVFSILDIMVSMSYHTGIRESDGEICLLSDIDEIFGSIAILDYSVGSDSRISDIFGKDELPLFLMDFDW